jgi:hypothetical protein
MTEALPVMGGMTAAGEIVDLRRTGISPSFLVPGRGIWQRPEGEDVRRQVRRQTAARRWAPGMKRVSSAALARLYLHHVRAARLIADGDWRLRGACRFADPDRFFPILSTGKSAGQAAEEKPILAAVLERTADGREGTRRTRSWS